LNGVSPRDNQGANMKQIHYDRLRYSWNNDNGVLVDVVFTPYTKEDLVAMGRMDTNPDEGFGWIEGTVESGGTYSRLFHATATSDWPRGYRKRFHYFTASRDVRKHGDEYEYTRCTV